MALPRHDSRGYMNEEGPPIKHLFKESPFIILYSIQVTFIEGSLLPRSRNPSIASKQGSSTFLFTNPLSVHHKKVLLKSPSIDQSVRREAWLETIIFFAAGLLYSSISLVDSHRRWFRNLSYLLTHYGNLYRYRHQMGNINQLSWASYLETKSRKNYTFKPYDDHFCFCLYLSNALYLLLFTWGI